MTTDPALTGIRILDLTRVWSGPLATRVLGDLGAEVIKIEHAASRGPAVMADVDRVRASFYPNNDPGTEPWNRSAAFNKLNRNKLSLTLDLAKPAGQTVMLQLAAISDVVIENYSPRVMGNLGIGFDTMSKLNAGIIMVSMPGYGLDGPMRDGVAYGSTLDAESGAASLMGYEGGGPQRLGVALPDPVAGLHAAGAVVTALLQRQRTGIGQHIDLSQLESMASFLGEEVIAYQLTGERPVRLGNRHPWMAPHGVYPCSGVDAWVFIGVASDRQWQNLCKVIEQSALTSDARFATLLARHKHQDELDTIVSAWTSSRTPEHAMRELQAVGIPAGAVLDARGLLADPHLRARGFFVQLDHPNAGRHEYPGQAIHLSETPAVFRSDAPRLGEHNHYVLHDLLGYDEATIAALGSDGVIADRPPA